MSGAFGSLISLGLDGEGVFEFLHARLQILDFSFLVFQEQVFDPVQASVDLGNILTYILAIFLAGHRLMDELSQALYGGDVFLCQMFFCVRCIQA
jgi:hypothetical protein